MPNYHVTVHGAEREAMADLVRVHGIRVYAQTLDENPDDCRVDAIADEGEAFFHVQERLLHQPFWDTRR